MANTKITIREKNLTTPLRGTSSSDVVYVPGISGTDNSPKNIATYITSEKQFRTLFGDAPYTLTANDASSSFITGGTYAFVKEGDPDFAYLYALQLLRDGLTIYYEYIVSPEGAEVEKDSDPISPVVDKVTYFYTHLHDAYNRLLDKNEYTIKYLTSGGYPLAGVTYTADRDDILYKSIAEVAKERGDCVALIDHIYDPAMTIDAAKVSEGLANTVNTVGAALTTEKTDKYAAMFTPWASYKLPVYQGGKVDVIMPASFAYLRCLAAAIKTAPNFLAMAGVARGRVPGIQKIALDNVLTSVIAEDFQPKEPQEGELAYSVNCITNIRPYGYTIWGNRTLAKVAEGGTTADNFLNTRNMLSDIKKICYSTAKELMFEQDSNTLWLRFKSGVSGVLESLKTGFGIKGYNIIRTYADENNTKYTRGTIGAVIRVYPLYAVEYFDIEIQVTDDDVNVDEG